MPRIPIWAAVLALPAQLACADGLDFVQPNMSILFEPGTVLQSFGATVQPRVRGTGAFPVPSRSGEIAKSFGLGQASFKTDLGERNHLGVFLTTPWGVHANYAPGTDFPLQGTAVDVTATRLVAVLRHEISPSVSVLAGANYETARGSATALSFGYSANFKSSGGAGYLLGIAYEHPETASRVSLTYESRISHTMAVTERLGSSVAPGRFKLDYPASATLEFSTAISRKNAIFGSARWAQWSKFSISPPLLSTVQPLLALANDSLTFRLGVGHKFNDHWSGAVMLDSSSSKGAGNPLQPYKGTRGLTLLAKYDQDDWSVFGAVQYVALGATRLSSSPFSTNDLTFNDNHAYVLSFGVAKRF